MSEKTETTFQVQLDYAEAAEILSHRLGMSRDEIDTMIANILNSKDSDETLRLIQFLVSELKNDNENEVKHE